MTPNVLRLVSRGKDHSGAMLPHLPKQWLRAPLTVEITCAADDDNATSLADVDSFTLMFRELNANRLPGDAPEGIVWYSEETPIAENLGKTKGPHARFELSAADVANITEAKDYWIAVHAVVGEDRILRAAGIIAFADDGFPAEAPTPTDPGDYYLTKAQADTLYAAIDEAGSTDISVFQDSTTVTVASSTGSDGTIVGATTTEAGVMTAAHVTSLGIKADLTGANFSGPVSVPNQITLVDTSSAFLINITGTAADDDLTFVLPTSSGTIATQAYVTGITNGKVSKSGDTMTGMLTVPYITITNSATFGTVLAHNEISTVATAVRENQLPNADGVFALASNTEGVPDKLGTRAKCNVAAGVTKGNVVYLDGADGSNPTFALANASSEATSSKTYGFIDRACAVNGFGFIITNGLLDGLSIAASYAEPGDSVWLSTVSGGIEIGIPPAKPAHSVYLGIATKVSNSGQIGATIQTIEVKVQNGYELAELHDVNDQVTGSTAFLVKNSGTGVWESKNSADARGSLGLGSIAAQEANAVAITGGSISGLSSLSAETITASTSAAVTANTASTSTTTGALVVTGGAGIGGAVFAGANSSFNGVPVGRGGSASGSVVAIGANAGSAASGAGCTFVGTNAGRFNTSTDNTAYGNNACEQNPGGPNNSFFGSNSGRLIGSGSGNTILGAFAARYISGGVTNCSSATNSIFVGHNAFPLANSQTNQIVIGTGAVGDGSDTTVIGTSSTISTRLPGGKFIVSSAASDSITTSGGIIASGAVSFTSTTASTSTTTGALVVTGGVGIGGAVFAGANSSFNGVTIGRGGSAQSSTIAIGGGLAGNAAGGAGSTCVGNAAGRTSTGANNTLIGSSAGESVASGIANSVLGATAYEGGSGSNNVIVGTGAARSIGAGDNNIIIGLNAGRFITGGSVVNTGSSGCVFIGRAAYPSAISQINSIVIGDQATGDGSNTTVIGRAATVTTRFAGTTTSAAIISGNELRIANSSTPAENAAGSIGAQRWDVNYQYVCTAINTTGAGITNAGTGGTNGTYRGVQLARVSGGTATEYPVVDVVISGTVVTSVTVVSGTAFSSAGNPIVMGLAAGQFAGGITGFQYTLETLTPTWKRIPLRSYSALIPISEGGTEASTAAGARANLGLETVVTDATTTRTLASADAASYIRFTSSSAITITIPTNATDPIPIGSEFFIRRAGTGAISLSNAGVTVNNSDIASLATGRVCRLKKVGTNEWDYIA